jgi:hypothetical protein
MFEAICCVTLHRIDAAQSFFRCDILHAKLGCFLALAGDLEIRALLASGCKFHLLPVGVVGLSYRVRAYVRNKFVCTDLLNALMNVDVALNTL